MTRRDYELIAATLLSLRPQCGEKSVVECARWGQWRGVCLTFAAQLESTNPRFDNARFCKACGLGF